MKAKAMSNSDDPVLTSSIQSSIAFGIASLGTIPMRYGQVRFPSLKRRFQNDMRESILVKDGNYPSIFALSVVNSIGKPQSKVLGNQHVLREGTNFNMKSGSSVQLSGAYVEITCSSNIYANDPNLLYDWITSALSQSIIRGNSVFADDVKIPVNVNIGNNFSWTDPVENSDSSSWADRVFNISVDFTINAISAYIKTTPRFKATVVDTTVNDDARPFEITLPALDTGDW